MDYIFVSSWAHGKEKGGIAQYSFDSQSGEMTYIQTLSEEKSCHASCVDDKRGVMYVLNESADLNGMRVGGGGEILIYRLNKENGSVELMAAVPTFCPNPAQFTLDASGKYMVVANHASRSYVTKIGQDENGNFFPMVLFDDSAVQLFAIQEDGSVGPLLDFVCHTGDGPGERQTNAHPHSAMMSPSGRLFAVCDKGSDEVCFYQIDREKNKLVLCQNKTTVSAGSMPRYCLFHPSKPFFYHNNEGSLDLHAYRYDESGALEAIGVCHVPTDAEGTGTVHFEQQGLCMDKAGEYIYDVLNGPNSVAVLKINQEDGTLTPVQNLSVGYAWARGAALSPDGKFLIVTCLKGGKIVVLRVGEDGMLTPTGHEYDQPCAAYASFWTT